jgi:hypothetical protein
MINRVLPRALLLLGLSLTPAFAATDEPTPALKGISAVTYDVWNNNIFKSSKCKVDWSALTTNLDFVANQSVNLTFVKPNEQMKEATRLYGQIKLGDPNYDEKENKARAYNFMPRLVLWLNIMDTGFSCSAHVEAELHASLKSTTIIANGASLTNPDVIIWETATAWIGPYDNFSASMVRISSDLLKEFANVWATSQKPDY